jgi:hypothetical protein
MVPASLCHRPDGASKLAGYDGLRRLCTASVARLPFRSHPGHWVGTSKPAGSFIASGVDLRAIAKVRGRRPLEGWIDPLNCEDILGVAYQAYEALTGQGLTVEIAGRRPWPPLVGQDWDFEDAAQMQMRYPRLWELCGWDEASSPPP